MVRNLFLLLIFCSLSFCQDAPLTIATVVQGCSLGQRLRGQCDSVASTYGDLDRVSLGSQDSVSLPSDLFFQYTDLTVHAVIDGDSVTVGHLSANGTLDGILSLYLVLHIKGPAKGTFNLPLISAGAVSPLFNIPTKCVSYYLYENSLEMFPSFNSKPTGILSPSISPSRVCYIAGGKTPDDPAKQFGGCEVLFSTDSFEGGYSIALDLDFDGDADSCKDKTLIIVLSVVIPIVVLIAVGVMIGVFIWFRKHEKPIEEIELERSAIDGVVIKNKIGAGAFGEVYIGTWQGTEVACKKLKEKSKMDEFVREAATLTKLSHPHIVQYLGVYQSPEKEKYIVTEYMTRGALDTLLRTDKDTIRTPDLIGIARHAALAMVYLAQRNIIHRDLSLRNFLVTMRDGRFQVKLSDFGLSRMLDKETGQVNLKESKIPIKWTSPEAIEHGTYSTMSDVWSFGVVMWELFSYSKLPYPGMSNQETIDQVSKGYRMPPPDNTPEFIAILMMRTWSSDPADRPSFAEILDILSDDTHKITPDTKQMDEPPTFLVDMHSMDNYSYTPGDQQQQQNIYNTTYQTLGGGSTGVQQPQQPQDGIYNTVTLGVSTPATAPKNQPPAPTETHYQALSPSIVPIRKDDKSGKQEVNPPPGDQSGQSHYQVISDLKPGANGDTEHYM